MKAIYLWRVVSDPRSGDGGGRPYARGELEHAMWAFGFQDGAAEKEGG